MPTLALAATGAGLISAVLHMSLLTGSFGAIILAYLAQLPLFLIGLWMGFAGAGIAALAALLALAAAGGLIFALVYLVVNAVPAIAMTYLAQLNRTAADGSTEFLPPGMLIACLVGAASAGFMLLLILLSGTTEGAEGTLRSFVETGLRQFAVAANDPDAFAAAVTAVARILPGVVAASWMAMVLVNAVLAQGLLARFGHNLRPSPKMAEIDLPGWMQGALVIAAIGAFLPGTAGFVGGNLVLIFTFAYTLAGLGVAHAIIARWPNRNLLLVAVYAFIFMFGWPAVLVALLGLAEPWLNLRRRTGGSTGT